MRYLKPKIAAGIMTLSISLSLHAGSAPACGDAPSPIAWDPEAANLCLHIITPAREYLHQSKVVFLGQAKASPPVSFRAVTPFLVLQSWRGSPKPGETVSVLLNIDGCPETCVRNGETYLVHIREEEAQVQPGRPISQWGAKTVPLRDGDALIAYLNAEQPPLSRGEILDVLEQWVRGERSAEDTYSWFRSANTLRDVSDNLSSVVLYELTPLLYYGVSSTSAAGCSMANFLGRDVLRFLHSHPDADAAAIREWQLETTQYWECLRNFTPCE